MECDGSVHLLGPYSHYYQTRDKMEILVEHSSVEAPLPLCFLTLVQSVLIMAEISRYGNKLGMMVKTCAPLSAVHGNLKSR